jgi:hypothetical protein
MKHAGPNGSRRRRHSPGCKFHDFDISGGTVRNHVDTTRRILLSWQNTAIISHLI